MSNIFKLHILWRSRTCRMDQIFSGWWRMIATNFDHFSISESCSFENDVLKYPFIPSERNYEGCSIFSREVLPFPLIPLNSAVLPPRSPCRFFMPFLALSRTLHFSLYSSNKWAKCPRSPFQTRWMKTNYSGQIVRLDPLLFISQPSYRF